MTSRSRWTWPMALALSALAGCNLTPPIDIESAVLVLPAANESPTMYFTVANRGNADVAITGITVDSSIVAELQSVTAHRMPGASSAPGERALMHRIERVEVPRRSTVVFAPGGYSVVLPVRQAGAPAFTRGDSVHVTVQLSSAWRIEARARVVTFAEFDGAATPAIAVDSGPAGADAATTLALGRRLYRGNGCAHCHGLEGAGDGPLAATLQPPPRNFRAMPVFARGKSPAAIAQTLATGLPGGGAMPLYPHLSRPERLAIAHYVLSLADSASPTSGSRASGALAGRPITRSNP